MRSAAAARPAAGQASRTSRDQPGENRSTPSSAHTHSSRPARSTALSGHSGARYPADVTVEINGAGAVVTGAGAGIGRALARVLAGAGARVVVNDLNFEAAT